jgi:hypothetical protein
MRVAGQQAQRVCQTKEDSCQPQYGIEWAEDQHPPTSLLEEDPNETHINLPTRCRVSVAAAWLFSGNLPRLWTNRMKEHLHECNR